MIQKKEIDGILPFVIGEDEEWQARFARFMQETNNRHIDDEVEAHRFRSLNQAYHCIWSIIRYMPWLRTLYLITCDQRLDQHDELAQLSALHNGPRLVYVDHTDIFEDPSQLPTFNPLAIQCTMFRINGLAEHFIYFEDDIVIMNPIHPSTLFAPYKQKRIAILNNPRKLVRFSGKLTESWQFQTNNSIDCLEREQFTAPFWSMMHFPIPFLKSAFEETATMFASEFASTARMQVRNNAQISPCCLCSNYMLQTHKAEIRDTLKCTEVGLNHENLDEVLRKLTHSSYSDFLNIIDSAQVVDNDPALRSLEKFYTAIKKRRLVNLKKHVHRLRQNLTQRIHQKKNLSI